MPSEDQRRKGEQQLCPVRLLTSDLANARGRSVSNVRPRAAMATLPLLCLLFAWQAADEGVFSASIV